MQDKIPEIKEAGFTHVWLPPPSESVAKQVRRCTRHQNELLKRCSCIHCDRARSFCILKLWLYSIPFFALGQDTSTNLGAVIMSRILLRCCNAVQA